MILVIDFSPLFLSGAHAALACKSRTSGRARVSYVVLLAVAAQGCRGGMMGTSEPHSTTVRFPLNNLSVTDA